MLDMLEERGRTVDLVLDEGKSLNSLVERRSTHHFLLISEETRMSDTSSPGINAEQSSICARSDCARQIASCTRFSKTSAVYRLAYIVRQQSPLRQYELQSRNIMSMPHTTARCALRFPMVWLCIRALI